MAPPTAFDVDAYRTQLLVDVGVDGVGDSRICLCGLCLDGQCDVFQGKCSLLLGLNRRTGRRLLHCNSRGSLNVLRLALVAGQH